MKKTAILLIMMTFLALTGCQEKPDNRPAYYGNWTAGEATYNMPIYAMTLAAYEQDFLGKTAVFSEDTASFSGETIYNPTYQEEYMNAQEFYENFRISLEDLGIFEDQVQLVHIKDWEVPGSTLWIKDANTLLTLWDGVFFELKRNE